MVTGSINPGEICRELSMTWLAINHGTPCWSMMVSMSGWFSRLKVTWKSISSGMFSWVRPAKLQGLGWMKGKEWEMVVEVAS